MNSKYSIAIILICLVLSLALLTACQDGNTGNEVTEPGSEPAIVTDGDEESTLGEDEGEDTQNTEPDESGTDETESGNGDEDTDPDTESDTESETESETESDTETDTETESESLYGNETDEWGMGPVMP
jgi:hypothetical protein